MRYRESILLKDGRTCVLRNAGEADVQAVTELFIATHAQTDYLASYADECTFTPEQEARFLKNSEESERNIEILAVTDGVVVGMAGNAAVGEKDKVRHRAEFGISVDQKYWGLGIGKALTAACVACAKKAGFTQLELQVVADNARAIALYEQFGFREFGRNPMGFRSRETGYQTLVSMRLVLEDGRGEND